MTALFLFDMDDVLYDYDWHHRMAGLESLTGHALPELRRRWWHDEGEWAAEAGRFPDGDSYLAAWNQAMGSRLTSETWLANRKSGMRARPDALAAVARASQLGQVSLLTNNNPLVGENLSLLAPELVPLFGLEHLRASSRYGARKPDPAVFRAAISAYGVPAESVFFADDLPENVAGAASIGITAHLYRDADGMLAAIEEFAGSR